MQLPGKRLKLEFENSKEKPSTVSRPTLDPDRKDKRALFVNTLSRIRDRFFLFPAFMTDYMIVH